MAKTIKPKFDFTKEIPGEIDIESYDPIHSLSLTLENGTRPEIFNELERTIVDLCKAVGDFDYESFTDIQTANDISQAIKMLSESKLSKIAEAAQEILSPVTFKAGVSFDNVADFKLNANFRGVTNEWIPNYQYIENSTCINDSTLYKAKSTHTSNPDNFLVDIANWQVVGKSGATVHNVDQISHGFKVGDILKFDYTTSEYIKAAADDLSNVGNIIVRSVINVSKFEVITDGYIDFESAITLEIDPIRTFLTTLETGKWYYLSDSDQGDGIYLTTTPPLIGQRLFQALSPTTALVVQETPLVGASIESDFIVATADADLDIVLSYPPINKDSTLLFKDGIFIDKSSYSLSDNVLTVPGVLTGERIDYTTWYSTNVNRGASFHRQRIKVEASHNASGHTVIPLDNYVVGPQYMFVFIDGVYQNDNPEDPATRSWYLENYSDPQLLHFEEEIDIDSNISITCIHELYVHVPAEESIVFNMLNPVLLANGETDSVDTDSKICTKECIEDMITTESTRLQDDVIMKITSGIIMPTVDMQLGDEFYNTDDDVWYKYNGNYWVEL